MAKEYSIAVIPGDGTGPEVVREGLKVLDAVAAKHDLKLNKTQFDFGGDRYLKTKKTLDDSDVENIKNFDAIYLGAIGHPKVKPGILEKEILLKLRFDLDLYVNLRPVKLYPNVWTPVKDKGPKDIDFVVVRENTEDMYVGIGGRADIGETKAKLGVKRSLFSADFDLDIKTEGSKIAYQMGIVSEKGAERVIRYAFEYAKKNGKNRVDSVDKANVLTEIYGTWREVFEKVSKGYPDIKTGFSFVDAVTMWFVKNPEWYQVIVVPNMFGDIITDLGAMIQGGMGIAAGANINPEGVSMFEPIGGSAPKYTGKNEINPLAAIEAGRMMLNHLGEKEAAKSIEDAVAHACTKIKSLSAGKMGYSTSELGDMLVEYIKQH